MLANVQPAQAGRYTVTVSNMVGAVTSAAATLVVNLPPAPTIITSPASQTVAQGSNLSLQVSATGLLLSFQWLKNGLNLSGQTNPSLSFNPVQINDAGNYTVVVSNAGGSVTSQVAVLKVNLPPPPTIITGPASQTVVQGSTIDLQVGATGFLLSFQWLKNGLNLNGQTNPSLSFNPVQISDAGNYTVVVSNAGGSVTSQVAVLTVFLPLNGFAYNVIGLDTLGGSYSRANAINNHGQVVGSASLPGDTATHTFLYSGGVIADIGNVTNIVGTISSGAGDINDQGQVVGSYSSIAMPPRAFLYSGGSMSDLGTLGGTVSSANAINQSGQVVGAARLPFNQITHAFCYSNGTMIDLGTLGGTQGPFYSGAFGVNDLGQIVGVSSVANYSSRAFLYSGGVMTDLGTLGGDSSQANAINNNGQVVGTSLAWDGSTNAFLYSGGTMTGLGTLGGNFSQANAINNHGQVVGTSLAADGSTNAFLYNGGTMTNLNRLIDSSVGWTLVEARDINNSGQIVGYGYNPARQSRAFLLNPVIRLTLPKHLSSGQLQMTLMASANQSYVIQVSTNLSSWLDWTNISPASLNTLIIDPDASKYNQRFYRALRR